MLVLLCVFCILVVCVCVYVCVCLCVCFAGDRCVCLLQQWYTSTMNLLGMWLTDRMDLQLHVYQLKILIRVVKVCQAQPIGLFQGLPNQLVIHSKLNI